MPESKDPQRAPRPKQRPAGSSGQKSPGTGRKSPAAGRKSPAAGRKSPAARQKSPGTGGKSPGTGAEAGGRRPVDPAVFRRRRIVLAVVLVLVIAAIGLGVWAVVNALGSGDEPTPTPAPAPASTSAPASSGTESAEPSEPATPSTATPTEEPEATEEPSIGATPPIPTACTPEQATLSVVTPATSAAGSPVGFSVEVATTTATPCLVDLGSESVTVDITSGDVPVWTSVHCSFSPAERDLLLGEEATDSQLVTWPGDLSVEGCEDGQPLAEPGAYRVVVTHALDGQSLEAEARFILE